MSLELQPIEDKYVQENFRRVKAVIEENPFQGMILLTLTFGKAETALLIPHGLSFAPKDVILTSTQGVGSFTVLFDQIDRTNLVVSTTGACVVRVLVGTLGGTT